MQRSASARLLRVAPVLLLFAALWTSPGEAQRSGQNRASMHDASIAPNFAYEPGTVRSYTCPVATGVRYTTSNVQLALQQRDFRIADGSSDGFRVPDDVQRHIGSVLGGSRAAPVNGVTPSERSQSAAALIAALTPPENSHPQARAVAAQLVAELDGLAYWAQQLNPSRPGLRDYQTARQVSEVIGTYNRFIEVSSLEYLSDNPIELVAIQTVLNQLVIAGLEYEGQIQVCMDGWTPPRVAPRLVRPLEVCLTLDDELREVIAIFEPATGDTAVVVDGQRVPLAEAFPETTALAGGRLWFVEDEAIAFREREYVKFGVSEVGSPAELVRAGEWRGVSVYVRRSDANGAPAVLYLPVAGGCEVQPYQPRPRARG